MKKFDKRGIGWINTSVIFQWIFTMSLVLFVSFLKSETTADTIFWSTLVVISLIEVIICTIGFVVLIQGRKGWVMFFLVYSGIRMIISLLLLQIPMVIISIFYLIGSSTLQKNN